MEEIYLTEVEGEGGGWWAVKDKAGAALLKGIKAFLGLEPSVWTQAAREQSSPEERTRKDSITTSLIRIEDMLSAPAVFGNIYVTPKKEQDGSMGRVKKGFTIHVRLSQEALAFRTTALTHLDSGMRWASGLKAQRQEPPQGAVSAEGQRFLIYPEKTSLERAAQAARKGKGKGKDKGKDEGEGQERGRSRQRSKGTKGKGKKGSKK